MTWDRTALRDRYGSPVKRINLSLTVTIVDDLRRMASDEGVSSSELVRDLIADEAARRTATLRAVANG